MTYYFDSEEFRSTAIYKNFINVNNGNGILKVEASTANLAYPLDNVSVEVSKMFGEDKVIFYEGKTNESGIIETIVLPTRKMKDEVLSIEDILYTTYDLTARDNKYNVEKNYDVSIFDNVKVIQPINFPVEDLMDGEKDE